MSHGLASFKERIKRLSLIDIKYYLREMSHELELMNLEIKKWYLFNRV